MDNKNEATKRRPAVRVGVMAAVMGLAAALGVGCSSQASPISTTPTTSITSNPVSWKTNTVLLTASNFWIVADGQTYLANPNTVDVHSDPGDPTYTTLELTWIERGNEMRFFTYFHADGSNWWSDQMRTYNGQASGDWLYYDGMFFQTPLGNWFRGDIDLTNDASDSVRGELHLHGLALLATLGPPVGP